MTLHSGQELTEKQVRWLLDLRRERAELFGDGLFEEPAWDILLELLAAELAGRRLTLEDLARNAPKSTVARWVAALEERRLVVCDAGGLMPAQLWIVLSRPCAAKLTFFLSRVLGAAPPG